MFVDARTKSVTTARADLGRLKFCCVRQSVGVTLPCESWVGGKGRKSLDILVMMGGPLKLRRFAKPYTSVEICRGKGRSPCEIEPNSEIRGSRRGPKSSDSLASS